MKIWLQAAGLLQLLLVVAHVPIARRLGWRDELLRVSLLTRQIFWVHTAFLLLVLTGFGLLGIAGADELLARGPLPRALLGGMAVFWIARLACQIFVFRREIWRGDRFRTRIHVLFLGLWTFLAAVYVAAFWRQVG